ncbi:MAG: hypothetical protein PHE78_00870, partial [Candidatus Gastranaerophilales bacterium]|nr:hypothetical protein [Candidatus Gastranaerophilales bacterium]
VGAALSPVIGPVGELISYAPALSYIFMDTKDKYHRGDENNYEKPSKKRAITQLAFQLMASVILPTAAVKASQAVANKVIDSKFFASHKKSLTEKISKNKTISKFLHRFADKPHDPIKAKKPLTKFAHGFQKVLDTITVAPLLFKHKANKSGARNLGLAAVGLATLGMVIKPIDHFVEHTVIKNFVHPAVHKTNL